MSYLKKLIFAVNNIRVFLEYWAILGKLIPTKILAMTNSQKLILRKNNK